MATNSINSNNINKLDSNSEAMDVDKITITQQDDQHQRAKCGLVGPFDLFACMHYIKFSEKNTTDNEPIEVDLGDILRIPSTNSTKFNKEIAQLYHLARKYFLTLYIYMIEQNEKKFYFSNNSSEQHSQKLLHACLVFDRRNGSCYPFYMIDNNKQRTVFSIEETSIFKLFEELVANYNWRAHFQTIQQSPDQDVSPVDQPNNIEENPLTTNVNRHIDNANNQSEILKGSDLYNLFLQQLYNLAPYVGSQLDNMSFSSQSSAYQLDNNDLTSLEAAFKALQGHIKMFWELSEMGVESLKRNRLIHTPANITETTSIVRNASLTDHTEHIFTNDPVTMEPVLFLDGQSTTYKNTYQPPITSNNFNQRISLPKLELSNQPARIRRQRTFADLRGTTCSAVQVEGAAHGTPLQFVLPKEINDHQKTLYLGAHAATYDKEKHDRNLLIPINMSVKADVDLKTNDLSNLIILNKEKNFDEFDSETKGVFSKIIQDELKSLRKKCSFKMVNLYQDKTITQELIREKKLGWSRLMFAIYIKLPNGQFERVSPPTFSDLIKETYGAQSVNIDSVVPDRFCEKGGQMVYIPLDQSAEKTDVVVYCNGKVLDELDYQIDKTILSFETPECKQARNDFIIIIYNLKTHGRVFFNTQYHPHDDHPEPCGVTNKN